MIALYQIDFIITRISQAENIDRFRYLGNMVMGYLFLGFIRNVIRDRWLDDPTKPNLPPVTFYAVFHYIFLFKFYIWLAWRNVYIKLYQARQRGELNYPYIRDELYKYFYDNRWLFFSYYVEFEVTGLLLLLVIQL